MRLLLIAAALLGALYLSQGGRMPGIVSHGSSASWGGNTPFMGAAAGGQVGGAVVGLAGKAGG